MWRSQSLHPKSIWVVIRILVLSFLLRLIGLYDVMAARMTVWAMLSSQHDQDCQDLALVAYTCEVERQYSTSMLRARTSHEISTIQVLYAETMRGLVDHDAVRERRGHVDTLEAYHSWKQLAEFDDPTIA